MAQANDVGRPRLRHATLLDNPSDQRWPAHQHDHNELVVPVQGALRVRADGQEHVAVPGHALHYARGVVHDERSVSDQRLVLLYVAWSDARGRSSARWPILHDDRGGRIAAAIGWMIDLVSGRATGGQAAADALLLATVNLLVPGIAPERARLLARVREAIVDRLAEPLVLDDLAAAAGLSRFHFARAFHAAVGVSPMRWLRQLRVEAARDLLLSTDMPLRAIAPRVGLGDEAALSRAFRQVTGLRATDLRGRPPG